MYLELYNKIIQYRLENPLYKINKDGKLHVHHIIQRYNGGNNDKSNLIVLTIREHRIIHWLLWKINNNVKDFLAYNRLGNSITLNPETKKYLSNINKIKWNNLSTQEQQVIINRLKPFITQSRSQETKQLMSKMKKNNKCWVGESNPFYGSSRIGDKNPMYDKKHSENSKSKMRKPKNFSIETRKNISDYYKSLTNEKNPNARKTIINGLEFNTRKEAAKHFGVGSTTIYRWLNKI